MDQAIPDQEVTELLGYLKNIHSYERRYQKSEASTITMIWGLFILVGGISDLYASFFAKYSPHLFPWVAAIASAIIAQQIISSQPLLYEKEDINIPLTRAKVSRIEVIVTIIAFALTQPIGAYNHGLVMPYIGIIFGTTNLFGYFDSADRKNNHYQWMRLLVIFSFYGSAIINLVLFYINEDFNIFAGFIFGTMVGSMTFLAGYNARSKLLEIIENEETVLNSENNH